MSKEAPDLIYSYRLTCFDGTAPCDDEGMLTLAICKRDMRRVIGREFQRQDKNFRNIWFIGLVGKELKRAFPEDPHKPGEILYIAKLTGIKAFMSIFLKTAGEKTRSMLLCQRFIRARGKSSKPAADIFTITERLKCIGN